MKNLAELIESLKEERKQLLEKIHKLEEFLLSDNLKKIDGESQNLLWEQWAHMRAYEKTLCKRIAHAVIMRNMESEKK